MASLFRRRISLRIAETVCRNLNKTEVEKIASLVRISSENMSNPQFQFSWKMATELKVIPEAEVTQEMLHILNGKGLILSDGVIKVEDSQDKYRNILFSVDRENFIKEVLLEAFNHVSELRNISPVYADVPKESVIVDFSSPNIAKPFHVGHIRSTIIGQFVCNLQEYMGNQVKRINYLGDWGTQYGILSAGYDRFASEEEMKKDPMKHLFNIYVASNREAESNASFLDNAKTVFEQMEAGNEEYMKRWRHLREISIREFSAVYTRLGIHFDEIHGESMYNTKASALIQELLQKNLAVLDNDGAVRMKLDWPNEEDKSVTLAKNDGSTLYLSREAAAAIERKDVFNFDKAIYVVDKSQTDHFRALKLLLKKIGYEWADNIWHVRFGRILGMSTRKGNVVFLDDLLNQAKSLAIEAMESSGNTSPDIDPEKTAEVLGISAVLINDFRMKRLNDYTFDWNRALHHKGDSGMELQYCHARLCSLEKTFGKLLNQNFDANVLCEPEALHLALHIARFDEVLHRANAVMEPYILVMYLFRLNMYTSKAYRELSLSRNERRIAEARYFLFHTARLVLHQGMLILGMRPLQEM